MQCIWTSTENALRRASSSLTRNRHLLAIERTSHPFSSLSNQQSLETPQKQAGFASVAHAFVSAAVRGTSIPPSPLPLSELRQPLHPPRSLPPATSHAPTDIQDSPQLQYTPKQLSRASAQAVRIAVREKNANEAFLIIKSLQASVMHYGAYGGRIHHPLGPVAIDFRQPVSPRLAIHALLHEFLRQGYIVEAGQVARELMYSRPNPRLHDRTLAAVNGALCRSGVQSLSNRSTAHALQLAKSNFSRSYLQAPVSLRSSVRSVESESTQVALQLFFAAKQYQRRRGKQMFQQIVDACLLQGEIIVVCFLFAFLVKQWQARSALASTSTEAKDELESHSGWIDQIVPNGVKDRSRNLRMELPSRSWTMARILNIIKPAINDDAPMNSKTIQPTMEEGAQALAILAGMLKEGLIQRDHLSNLVNTLVSFPSSPVVTVWTLSSGKQGKWERRDARRYFDEVLDAFVDKLGNSEHSGFSLADENVYSALVRYSLRRKLSPVQAEKVVRSMRDPDGRSLVNIHTYNELLRGATLLRRNDMCSKVLEVLRSRPENASHPVMHDVPLSLTPEPPLTVAPRSSGLETSNDRSKDQGESVIIPDMAGRNGGNADILRGIFGSDFNLSLLDPSLSSESQDLKANIRTLINYLKYKTASGHPEIVVDLVLILIPELKSADYPVNSAQALALGKRRHPFRKDVAVQRALGLGPQFFVAALNGVVKAGRTGLAERLWRLAKETERVSWTLTNVKTDTDAVMGTQSAGPWALPIAGYTIMLQCYAKEMKKSLRARGRRVEGWAMHVIEKRRKAGQSTGAFEVSREMGMLVFNSVQTTRRKCFASRISSTLKAPCPDERFFNAALSLFDSSKGGKRLSAAQCRRLRRRRLDQLLNSGIVESTVDPDFLTVIQAMHAAGYELPEGYQHRLVGIRLPPVAGSARHVVNHSPYPKRPVRRPLYRLPVTKTKGLPAPRTFQRRKGGGGP